MILGESVVGEAYIHLGSDEIEQLERVYGQPYLWKYSAVLPGNPIKDGVKYKYGFFRKKISVRVPYYGRVGVGNDLSYCEEVGQRCVNFQAQFDVFQLQDNKQYLTETFPKAVLFYLKWLLPLVYPSSISETLTQIESLSFGLLNKKHVKTCVSWIVEEALGYSVTEAQRLYLCIVLGHLNNLQFPLPLSRNRKMIETCDRLLQCLIPCVRCNFLSTSDLELLQKIAVLLVENSSSPGWLTLAAHFYPYLGIEYILRKKNAKGLHYRYDDNEYHKMIGALLINIKDGNDQIAPHKELLHLLMKEAPTFDDALDLFKSNDVQQFFASEGERVDFFTKFYKSKSRDDSTQKKSAGAQLVELYKIPKDVREKMKEDLFLTLLEYSKSDDELEDEQVDTFLSLIVFEDCLNMDQVLELLMELSKSKSVPRQDLLRVILDNELFGQDWDQTTHVAKVKICKSWVITRFRNNEQASSLSGVDKVVAVYKAIDFIMRCYLNISNRDLAQDVSTYVVETILGNEDTLSVLQAFANIEECVADVQDCYKSHVRKILEQTPMVVKRSSNFLKAYSNSRCACHAFYCSVSFSLLFEMS